MGRSLMKKQPKKGNTKIRLLKYSLAGDQLELESSTHTNDVLFINHKTTDYDNMSFIHFTIKTNSITLQFILLFDLRFRFMNFVICWVNDNKTVNRLF